MYGSRLEVQALHIKCLTSAGQYTGLYQMLVFNSHMI